MISRLRRDWDKPVLAAIMLLAAYLTCWKIWTLGYGNEYYTAAVTSMLKSWHNFFFASFDPGGFITVDKPAPGLWLQCLSALLFGVHGWSVILPEALCSVISVAVLYHIVKRSFGKCAGLIASLFLSLTPIFVAASRSNNLDAALVLVCLLAMWALDIAAERGSLRYLILTVVLLGIGFNIKTLQAYMYLPAVYLVYFFGAEIKYRKRLLHLLAATAVLIAVSLSWTLAVDLTPAADRPYVGSSSTNSELELALGYNGIDRVLSDGNSSKGVMDVFGSKFGTNSGIPNEGGTAGILRMFNQEMAGQMSWLLALAGFGLLALILRLFKNKGEKKRRTLRQILLWGGLFIPMYAFFSISGHFHRYYMIMFAPCVAALAAIAVTEFLKDFSNDEKNDKWSNIWFPAALLVTAAVQIYILKAYYSAYAASFVPIVAAAAVISATALIILKVLKKERLWYAKLAAAVGIIGIMLVPAYWSYTTVKSESNVMTPTAGPNVTAMGRWNMGNATAGFDDFGRDGPAGEIDGAGSGRFGELPAGFDGTPGDNSKMDGARQENQEESQKRDSGGKAKTEQDGNGSGMPRGSDDKDGGMMMGGGGFGTISEEMISYMLDNNDGERFLVAVPNATSAEQLIIKYGVGVMAVGGFRGTDNAISLDNFITLVKNGELRYYWINGNPNSEIARWVEANATKVDSIEWGGQTGSLGGNSGTLYDLSSLRN